jgi:hypothetical protein
MMAAAKRPVTVRTLIFFVAGGWEDGKKGFSRQAAEDLYGSYLGPSPLYACHIEVCVICGSV